MSPVICKERRGIAVARSYEVKYVSSHQGRLLFTIEGLMCLANLKIFRRL